MRYTNVLGDADDGQVDERKAGKQNDEEAVIPGDGTDAAGGGAGARGIAFPGGSDKNPGADGIRPQLRRMHAPKASVKPDWHSIASGTGHTVALKDNGTVVAVGNNTYGQCKVDDWTDIVAISAGTHHTVGLKADGTVVAAGSNSNEDWKHTGQCEVEGLSDVVAIAAGSTGKGQDKVSSWKNIRLPVK